MRLRRAARRAQGFTLVEVLVALVIVALGMSALLETLSASADNVAALRDRTAAEWIAMNLISEARLSLVGPPIGTIEGDVLNCANADWHWQRQIIAINQIPGLLGIVVNVQRTGNATAKDSSATNAAGTGGSNTTLGASAANGSLGSVGALGSTNSTNRIGCIDSVTPGSSLGGGATGSPGAVAGGSIGASGSMGASGPLGPSSATSSATSGAAVAAAGAAGTGVAGAPGSGGSLLSSLTAAASSSGNGKSQSWLVTLTGFRGNSLGAASGESPDWIGSNFAGNTGQSGIPGNTNGGSIQNPTQPAIGASGSSGAIGATGSTGTSSTGGTNLP